MEKINSIRVQFSWIQKALYWSKKLLFPVIVILAAFGSAGDGFIGAVLVKQAGKAGLGLVVAILGVKFMLPKIALQTELIEDQNVAVAVVVGAIILGVCLA